MASVLPKIGGAVENALAFKGANLSFSKPMNAKYII